MVDLVKIRRKAREKKEQAEAAAHAEAGGVSPAVVTDADVAPAKTVKSKRKKRSGSEAVSANEREVEPLPESDPRTTPASAAAIPETVAAGERLEHFRRTAGTQRDASSSEDVQHAESESEHQIELLVFQIASEQYAVDISHIREITRPRTLTRVPNSEEAVMGIISLRGTIVTILDARRKLGHRQAGDADDDTRVIVVEQGSEIAGFTVDRVFRVLSTSADTLESHPVVSSNEQSRYIRGVFRYNDRITILLDLERLLEQDEYQRN